MKKKVLECIAIEKSLDRKPILSDFSLTVHEGDINGIVGPVGVGKTTLLYLILGLIRPDAGQVKIQNMLVTVENEKRILQFVNFASSSLKLAGYSTVWENLITFANLYQIEKPKEKIDELIHAFKIEKLVKQNRKLYNLSAGELTKVMLCKAFINNPDLLLLDEITAHLDPPSIFELKTFIKSHMKQKGKAIVWVSHNYNDIREFCTKFTVFRSKKTYRIDTQLTEEKFKKLYV